MSQEKALDYMKKTGITVDDFLKRVATDKTYKYKTTRMYKAMRELEKAARARPRIENPPQRREDLSDVQRCLFLTGDISRALETKNRLLIATADLGYRRFYTTSFLSTAIDQNRLRVWCDCRAAGEGTPPEIALDWLNQLGLPDSYFYGQGETAEEFRRGYDAGARKFVVNLSALTGKQLDYVKSGEVHVTNETYFNVQRDYPINWRNANNGVGSNTVAVYASSREGATYYSLRDQAVDGKYLPSRDCVYVAGFTEDDWNFVVSS